MDDQIALQNDPPEPPSALEIAIEACGGQSALAGMLDPPVKAQAVQQWRRVPSERVIDVAKATGFKVTPHALRPDLYPHPDDGLPIHLRGAVSAAPGLSA